MAKKINPQKAYPSIPPISAAEWEVMKVFWKNGSLAAREVYAALPEGHTWAYKTVKTFLARLVRKEALSYTQVGNSYLYTPLYSHDDYARACTHQFVLNVFDGNIAAFLSHALEDTDIPPSKIATILKLLADT